MDTQTTSCLEVGRGPPGTSPAGVRSVSQSLAPRLGYSGIRCCVGSSHCDPPDTNSTWNTEDTMSKLSEAMAELSQRAQTAEQHTTAAVKETRDEIEKRIAQVTALEATEARAIADSLK